MPKHKRHGHHQDSGDHHHHKSHSDGGAGSQRGPAATAAGTLALHEAMISNESPEPHSRDPFLDLKDQSCSGTVVTASVQIEPALKHDESSLPAAPQSNPKDEEAIECATTTANKTPNGVLDDTDSTPLKANNIDGMKMKIDEEKENDEGCGIRCLYYTMQCCECTIM